MMKNEQHNAAHIRAMAAGLRDGMGGHADACADLMEQLAKGVSAFAPRCACGDGFTEDAMCANCIAAATQAQQAAPVAWLYTRTFNGETFLAKQCEDWPHHTRQPLYTAPPRSKLLQVEPDGYALVPIEPTEKMLDAAGPPCIYRDYAVEAYRAMLAAAQKGGAA